MLFNVHETQKKLKLRKLIVSLVCENLKNVLRNIKIRKRKLKMCIFDHSLNSSLSGVILVTTDKHFSAPSLVGEQSASTQTSVRIVATVEGIRI